MPRFLAALLLLLLVPVARADAAPDPAGVWPLSPVPQVVNDFAPPDSPWGAGHRGVDLLGTPGQRVRAARAGTVSFVGTIAGRGVVTVNHGDTRTTYQPVATTLQTGAVLGAGDELGRLVLPGSHCFPRACLHWGWLRETTYLDPLGLVGAAGPVRLLPLGGLTESPAVRRAATPPYADWVPLVQWVRPGLQR